LAEWDPSRRRFLDERRATALRYLDYLISERFQGYDFLLSLERASMSLSHAIIHGGVAGREFLTIRKIAKDLVNALAHLHGENRIHADIKPLNVVRVEMTWQLIDLDVACCTEIKVSTPWSRRASRGTSLVIFWLSG